MINANTKIASLLKQHPGSLEAIISLSPKFTKLRNPLLRKLMAARTSIAMASKIGGCSVDDFFEKLQPLGFEIDKATVVLESDNENKPVVTFMKNIAADRIIELDVRPVLESGKDPLDIILQKLKILETGSVFKIINSFKPTPLIHLLNKQGFESHEEQIYDELVYTFFYKKTAWSISPEHKEDHSKGWDEILDRFSGHLVTIDVSQLPMPLPMHTIMDALQTLPKDKALFVYHKRIPVFLLPELETQQFSYRIKEIREGEVNLLIFKD